MLKRLIAEIKRKGIPNIKPSIKGQGSIMQGVQFIQGFKIYVHPTCVNTIEELNTTHSNKIKKELVKPTYRQKQPFARWITLFLERFHLPHKQTKQMLGRILAPLNQWAYKEG